MSTIAATSPITFVSASSRAIPPAIDRPGDETALFRRFVAGEDAAFVALFGSLNPRLHTYAARLLGSAVAADDITQAIWEKLVRMRGSAPRIDNIGGFLMRMARNACVNAMKRQQRSVPLDTVPDTAMPRTGDEADDRAALVEAAMEQLSFDDRELLVLHVDCGYRLEEIAAMKGTSPEAMWTRASRARKRLRTLVMARLEEDD